MAASIRFNKDFLSVTYTVAINEEEDGCFICEIPSFKINFFANNREEVERKSRFMMQSFFSYYNIKNHKFGKLIMDVNKLGFKAPQHNLVMYNALKKKIRPEVPFSREEEPSSYRDLEEYNMDTELV